MIHNNEHILIIGGYGSTGSVIARQLSERFPGQIVVAGRSLKKAERFALELNRKVTPLELDISTIIDYDSLLEGIWMVVMCLELDSVEIARQCLLRGIHYMDISASYSILNKIEALHETCQGKWCNGRSKCWPCSGFDQSSRQTLSVKGSGDDCCRYLCSTWFEGSSW